MDTFTYKLADLLLDIEAQMRRLAIWETEAPPATSLQSLVPFCHDTLKFEQWLQWVFLPRMKRVVEGDEECPTSSEITPLAEYRFNQLKQTTAELLTLIEQFDRLINSANH